ncbi:hypothetical protein GCM10008955_31980 [Deinococcus malanensis]|uniref:SIS domain-containing protein n=2 Tax=Deinococcus malanensis TaxID=1706855 RepID=A0ABQ2F2Y9_9DEIO|nr:SIS domain-containing protein [Deinococcus malanensis]GGK35667.1 hypothetical protein GCM10008955_31980 [Deinococcus malanensis]
MTLSATRHFQDIQRALATMDASAVERAATLIHGALVDRRAVYLFGNGASAALASHMAGDPGKNTSIDLGQGPGVSAAPRLRVLSLSDNVPWMTALGNDVSYDDGFLEQLKNHLVQGDVAIGISGSGGSVNILRALKFACASGASTIMLTGTDPKSALARPYTDLMLQAPSADIDVIEAVHVAVHHAITRAVAARERGEVRP